MATGLTVNRGGERLERAHTATPHALFHIHPHCCCCFPHQRHFSLKGTSVSYCQLLLGLKIKTLFLKLKKTANKRSGERSRGWEPPSPRPDREEVQPGAGQDRSGQDCVGTIRGGGGCEEAGPPLRLSTQAPGATWDGQPRPPPPHPPSPALPRLATAFLGLHA